MGFERFRKVLRSMMNMAAIRPCGPSGGGDGIWVAGEPVYLRGRQIKRWDVAWLEGVPRSRSRVAA